MLLLVGLRDFHSIDSSTALLWVHQRSCCQDDAADGHSKEKSHHTHHSSTPKAFPKRVAMGPMRLDTLSLVAAMALRILSTTAAACRR